MKYTEAQIVDGFPDGVPLDHHFVIGEPNYQVVGFWDPKWGVMAHVIEDDELSEETKAYLLQRGNPVFRSSADVFHHAATVKWPGWDKFPIA